MKKKQYKYFISWFNANQSAHAIGFGNGDFTLEHKIKNSEDIRKVEEILNKGSDFKHTVINYQLLETGRH